MKLYLEYKNLLLKELNKIKTFLFNEASKMTIGNISKFQSLTKKRRQLKLKEYEKKKNEILDMPLFILFATYEHYTKVEYIQKWKTYKRR